MEQRRPPLVILHVTAPAPIGGLERVVEALCAGHAARGHVVHVAAVVATQPEADAFFARLAQYGVQPHALVLPGRAYLRERALLADVCRAVRPSVVHTHGYRADVLASPVARGLGIRTVTTVHGFTGGSWRNRIYEVLQVRAFRRFDAVVAVSRPLAALLEQRGVPPPRLRMVVNAWAPLAEPAAREAARRSLGISSGSFRVGWVGRLTAEKGAEVLLAAAALLPHDVTFSFVGDGRERMALERQAAAIGLGGRVRWHGAFRNAGTLVRAFDVFVLSSHTEGTPMVLFEAMEARVPVIATRVGGVPDVVSDAEAFLIRPNDPAALAHAVMEIRTDPAAAELRVAAAAHRLRTGFAVEPWLDEYDDLYRGESSSIGPRD